MSHAPYCHTLKFVLDGIEHVSVLRASTLDDLWKGVHTVTHMVKMAREKAHQNT